MKKLTLLAATAALALSGVAVAGPSYTYVDGGITIGDSFGDNSETEGLALRGSFGFADIFHVGGGYGQGDLDGGKSESCFDVTSYNLYFGVNPAITENMDLVSRIGYAKSELDADGFNDLELSGLWLEVGPRAMVGEKLELNAAVTLFTGEVEETSGCTNCDKDDLNEFGFRVGGEYYFTPAFSVGLDSEMNGFFGDAVNIHGRWSFGNN